MLTNRTSLIAWVAVGTLGLATAGATTANAQPCPFSGFTKPGNTYSPRAETKPRKVHTARVKDKPITKPASSYAQAAKPAKTVKLAAPPVSRAAGPPVSKVASPAVPKVAVLSKAASPPVSTPAEPEVSACLTKEYLETGAVMFKDSCTKEWAINATHVTNPGAPSTARTCLSKDMHRNGVVMFKDDCTKEWAMNTAEQRAQVE